MYKTIIKCIVTTIKVSSGNYSPLLVQDRILTGPKIRTGIVHGLKITTISMNGRFGNEDFTIITISVK